MKRWRNSFANLMPEVPMSPSAYWTISSTGEMCIRDSHYTFEEYRQTFRHQGSQRLVYPVGYYTKVKHLVIYNLQFTIYEALYNGNASTDYSCVAKLYIVHCKLYLPLPINIWHYVIQRSPDCNQVGNLCSAANGIYSAYQR